MSRVAAANPTEIVEHVVLFKLKPDADPSKVPAMVDSLNSLASLDSVLHLAAGPVIRSRSPPSLAFTHALHSRFSSKADLVSCYTDPDHLVVINETKPLFEDVMAVDWVHPAGSVTITPGSCVSVTLLKLKENLGEKEKNELLGLIGEMKEKFPGIEAVSFGENESPARAKGFSVASVCVFKGVKELEGFHSEWESPVNELRDLVRDKVEEVLVVDFVLP